MTYQDVSVNYGGVVQTDLTTADEKILKECREATEKQYRGSHSGKVTEWESRDGRVRVFSGLKKRQGFVADELFDEQSLDAWEQCFTLLEYHGKKRVYRKTFGTQKELGEALEEQALKCYRPDSMHWVSTDKRVVVIKSPAADKAVDIFELLPADGKKGQTAHADDLLGVEG